ncbi:MAG: GNAT family N-acetyltransferase [Anaerolineae bacterium]|nr:GNAT family N-acetyltransferase [Anaerolineae bacterium]
MSTLTSLVIRDGLESDIPGCLGLDHHYQTDYVWQMSVAEEGQRRQIVFHTEHLPRTMEAQYPPDERRLIHALQTDQCFLVAAEKQGSDIFGYLTMYSDPVYRTAWIQSLVVGRPYRRCGIASRLLNVTRQWAQEHHLNRMTIETQTKNYPAILFCQQAGFEFCGFNDQYFPDRDIALFFSQVVR